jgi:chemotaxis protein CheX
MTATEARLALPATLSSAAAPDLLERLLALRGAPLALEAEGVRKLGGQCAQVLMSAALTWKTDGHGLRVVDPSAEFGEALRLLGLSLDSVTAGDRAR